MGRFGEIYPGETQGQLEMFDRVIFKGYLSGLYPAQKQFDWFLHSQNVLLKDFAAYQEQTTAELKENLMRKAVEAGCEISYMGGKTGKNGESKEEMARQIAEAKGMPTGMVAILSTLEVENCMVMGFNREKGWLESKVEPGKHLHYYIYYNDREFGWMYVRLQSRWPFNLQIYINGHEWLAHEMDQAGIGYVRHDNTFWQIDDLPRVQAMCDKMAHRQWERVWNHFAQELNPFLPQIEASVKKGYYWTIEQFECATDVMFGDKEKLDGLLPELFQESFLAFGAEDVMRFLGRKLSAAYTGKVETRLNKREPGWRIKHWLNANSLKMYNNGQNLRVETTINKADEFHIPTPEASSSRWKRMPKGVSNFWHFYQTARAANQRYLDALASLPIQDKRALDALDSLCQPQGENPSVPKFQPLSVESCALFAVLLRGEFLLNGFRNQTLRQILFPNPPADPQDEQRLRARITRLLAKLRGHKLIEAVPGSRQYRVTLFGRRAMYAALRLRFVDFPLNFSLAF